MFYISQHQKDKNPNAKLRIAFSTEVIKIYFFLIIITKSSSLLLNTFIADMFAGVNNKIQMKVVNYTCK